MLKGSCYIQNLKSKSAFQGKYENKAQTQRCLPHRRRFVTERNFKNRRSNSAPDCLKYFSNTGNQFNALLYCV